MIQTTINYSDPIGGIEAPAEVVAAMQEASRMLEDMLQDKDPLEFNALWQFQRNDRLGPYVALRLSCDNEVIQVAFAVEEFRDSERLRGRISRVTYDIASKISNAIRRRLLKMQEEWKSAAAVEG